jgi:hypothetical protein
LSWEHYQRYLELYEAVAGIPGEPWFGWLCNRLPGYPDTLLLKTNVQLRRYPQRPSIELEPTGHPLVLEQREGLTLGRLREIWEANEHRGHAA